MNDQLIHGEVIQLSTTKKFFITFVYGRNLEEQRLPLWDNIKEISQSLEGPWSIFGDFNSIRHQGERIGGLMSLIEKLRSLQNEFNNATDRDLTMKGLFLLAPIRQLDQKLTGPSIMTYVMKHLFTHMCMSWHRACQITPLSFLVFPLSLNPRAHSFSVMCRLKIRGSRILLSIGWLNTIMDQNWKYSNKYLAVWSIPSNS